MSGARPIDRRYTKVVARQEFLSPADEAQIVEVLRRRLEAEQQDEQGAIRGSVVRSVRRRAAEAEERLIGHRHPGVI